MESIPCLALSMKCIVCGICMVGAHICGNSMLNHRVVSLNINEGSKNPTTGRLQQLCSAQFKDQYSEAMISRSYLRRSTTCSDTQF